jgi:hypothetical protein
VVFDVFDVQDVSPLVVRWTDFHQSIPALGKVVGERLKLSGIAIGEMVSPQ